MNRALDHVITSVYQYDKSSAKLEKMVLEQEQLKIQFA
jgi:hypothetical protein